MVCCWKLKNIFADLYFQTIRLDMQNGPMFVEAWFESTFQFYRQVSRFFILVCFNKTFFLL